ncbi:MAG: hypothetical protein RMY28_015895 [Nostoc sp. ChiSLP01]|nr:hypothetical protein [Nostoc sp. CmiSLP01]MDZ8286061.1 hypothetical protein [Nostoc sp. ChiSLP01]
MQDKISEIQVTENYIKSLISSYQNKLEYATKETDKKLLLARIDTCNSILNYLEDRKNIINYNSQSMT